MEQESPGSLPSPFDRAFAMLHDLPDVVKSRIPATIRNVPVLGVGGVQTIIVQTVRHREKGDTIFLEVYGEEGSHRLVLPPVVADAIARQRDSLSTMLRKRISKAAALDRKARGIEPGFMKGKRKKGGRS